MFDKLIEFFLNQINNIIPIAIIHQYQGGCMYTFGKNAKQLGPGWHFKIPYIQTFARDLVVDTTNETPAQSVITADNIEIIIKGSIGFKIVDVIKYFNNVYDTKSALIDRGLIVIKEIVSCLDFNLVEENVLKEILKDRLQEQVEKYGIEIQYFALSNITKGRSFRLFNESSSIII
jgi:regulator of protease activity HflC (stomatin/prohibitin superfamily)